MRRLTALIALAIAALAPASASAAGEPTYAVDAAVPDYAQPGERVVWNTTVQIVSGADGVGTTTFEVEYPEWVQDVTLRDTGWSPGVGLEPVSTCSSSGSTLTCEITDLPRYGVVGFSIEGEIAADASGTGTVTISASGGGAAEPTVKTKQITVGVPPLLAVQRFEMGARDSEGEPEARAGSAPANFDNALHLPSMNRDWGAGYKALKPVELLKDAVVHLPPGLLGNPLDTPRCPLQLLVQNDDGSPAGNAPRCSPESQVGELRANVLGSNWIGIYNLVPPPGTAAAFGFYLIGVPVVFTAQVRPDYGVDIRTTNTSTTAPLTGADVTIWGNPADPSHDSMRGRCWPSPGNQGPIGKECPSEEKDTPHRYLRLPTSCSGELPFDASVNTYEHPGTMLEAQTTIPGMENCDQVPFDPDIAVVPTTNQADSPTGLEVDLAMPQQGLEEPGSISESDLRKAVVKLPQGMSVNPSAADGLGACTTQQIGLMGTSFDAPAPIRFTTQPPQCPDNAKVGTATIQTPLLDHPLTTDVYIAAQQDNPFKSLLAIYIAGYDADSGVALKLPGLIEADPNTGQLTATFDNNPQTPFTSLHMELYGGPRAALRTPATCGTHQIHATLSPWSGTAAVDIDSPFQITSGPGGSPCPQGSFDPTFTAGTQNPLGGAFTPFALRLTRQDATAQITSLGAKLPEGLVGAPAGIPYCSEAALASISGIQGTGQAQITSPACPAASQVGTVTVGAGAGPTPVFVKTGRAYLAGPYKGAPLSLAVIAPAVAGPFDLGSVLVRNPLYVDPTTAQVSTTSDPIPTILHGVPLDLRDVRVDLDRSRFTLNPTDCDPKAIEAQIGGEGGQSAQRSQRFQVAGCADLPFKPKLSLKLKGDTERAGHPALRAVLTMPPAGANIASVSVALPHSLFLDQSHIGTICTRVQFAADQCPKRSIYGKATAYSPLIDQPLTGNVYLRSSSNELPDLVADLRGQIRVEVAGRIDTDPRGGIRTTFQTVPDAPVSKFVLEMKGQKKGLLENSRDLCAHTFKATAAFDGQNGKIKDMRPKLGVKCGKGRKR